MRVECVMLCDCSASPVHGVRRAGALGVRRVRGGGRARRGRAVHRVLAPRARHEAPTQGE